MGTRIDASKIKVIGAGLVAKDNSSIGLQVKKTDRNLTAYNTDLYSNIYSFEMNLVKEDGTTSREVTELAISIMITLPLPANTGYTTVRILHFLSNGKIKEIYPVTLDGKVKFTITHFSTFAFADVKTTSGSGRALAASGSSAYGGSGSSGSISSTSGSSGGSGGSGSVSKMRGKGSSRGYYSKIGKTGVQYDAPALGYKIKTATIPDTVKIGKKTYKVTAIPENAFTGYDRLASVAIGKNVRRIDPNAFSGCKKLKSITVQSKKLTAKKVKGAFKDSGIKTVYVPADKRTAYKKMFKKAVTGSKGKVAVKAKKTKKK